MTMAQGQRSPYQYRGSRRAGCSNRSWRTGSPNTSRGPRTFYSERVGLQYEREDPDEPSLVLLIRRREVGRRAAQLLRQLQVVLIEARDRFSWRESPSEIRPHLLVREGAHVVGLERERAVPTAEHGHEQRPAGVRPLEAVRIIDAVLDDDEVVALTFDFPPVKVVFSWSISRSALSAAAALSACAAASLTRLDARHIFAFVSSARRLASRCVATLWRSFSLVVARVARLYRLALLFLWHPDLAPLVELLRVVSR